MKPGIASSDGRTLTLHLLDGSPFGVIKAGLGNWLGEAVAAPRTALAGLLMRKEAKRTGVYLLMGKDPGNPDRDCVYVGEGNVGERLALHDKDESKQFYERVCAIVARDDSLNKADVRYLEAKLMALVRRAGRAELANNKGSDGDRGLPEGQAADMDRFLSDIKTLLPVLGFDVLRGADEADGADAKANKVRFVFKEGGTSARAMETGGEFVVLAESLARITETPTIGDGSQQRRRQFLKDGTFVKVETDCGERYRFTRNVPFSSPSSAAAVVYGGQISGPACWKSETDGEPYKDWRQRQIREAQWGQ